MSTVKNNGPPVAVGAGHGPASTPCYAAPEVVMKSPILLITTILGGLGTGTVYAQGNDAEGSVRAMLESVNNAVVSCKIDEYARHCALRCRVVVS